MTNLATLIKQHKIALSLLTITALGLLAYSNTFKVPFVFDDLSSVASNTAIRSFHGLISDWHFQRIVGNFTFAINYRIRGLGVTSYHIFNLAFHLLSAMMVFVFVSLTLRTPFFTEGGMGGPEKTGRTVFKSAPLTIALFSGLLFVAHPVETEAVTYIVQRQTSLAALFYLLAIIFYATWRLRTVRQENDESAPGVSPKPGNAGKLLFAISLLMALLAMGTKEIAFTLPIIIALWELLFFSGPVRKRLLNILPFVLTTAVIPLSLFSSHTALLAGEGDTAVPPAFDYLLTQFRVMVTYLRLMVLPIGQNLDYDYPVYRSFTNPDVFLSFVLLLLIIGMGVFLLRQSKKSTDARLLRLIAFGIFWFFITLLVESSLIPIADVIFEHRLYLPSIGLIIAAVTAVVWGASAIRERAPLAGKVAVAGLALITITLGAATYARNRVWHDPVTLWSDAVQKSPEKARPHNGLGAGYKDSGMVDQAASEFELAISLRPDYGMAHYNLGIVRVAQDQLDQAMSEFELAAMYGPNFSDAFNNLGVGNTKEGKYDQAIVEFNKAINLQPDFPKAYNNLGQAYVGQGSFGEAESAFIKASQQDPGYADAYLNLGGIYVKENRFSDALDPLLHAASLDPGNPGPHVQLGDAYKGLNQYDKAVTEYYAALKLDPNDREATDKVRFLEAHS